MGNRLNVLINAYTCSPYQGSEFAVSWGLIERLRLRHKLSVIVEEEKCREDIEKYLEENPEFSRSVNFYFIKKQRNRLLRKIWPPSYYWYYKKWHADALHLARSLHAKEKFDIAHQLTMVGFREPGYLWQLQIPFVWGPVGGMGRMPWRFFSALGWYDRVYYTAYNFVNACQEQFLSRPRIAANRAGTGLIAATPTDQEGTRRLWGVASSLLPEVGLPPKLVVSAAHRQPGEPLRVVWSGLHIGRKALNLGLLALAQMPSSVQWELHVLGRGKLTSTWKKLAVDLGISERCNFHGWVPREEGLRLMESAHVMLITSLRDLTSTVTVEALAQGLPIVCLDHCGFGGVVDASCGIKVPVTSQTEAVAGLGRAIAKLDNEALRFALAEGALVRAKDFAWEHKADVVDGIYRQKLAESFT